MKKYQAEKALEDLELLSSQFLRILSEYSNHINRDKARREMVQFEEPYNRLRGRLEGKLE